MTKTFLVIGLGRFGSQTAKKLIEYKQEVFAIDQTPALVDEIAPCVTKAAVVDCRDKLALKRLGISDFDAVILAIGSDFEASVLALMNLKELGAKKIVCKANNETHKTIMEKLGVDKVMIPEYEYADRLAKNLSSRNVFDFMELSDGYGIIEMAVPNRWVGHSIKTLALRAKYGINVLAIKHDGKVDVSFEPNRILNEGESMLILGETKNLEKVQKT